VTFHGGAPFASAALTEIGKDDRSRLPSLPRIVTLAGTRDDRVSCCRLRSYPGEGRNYFLCFFRRFCSVFISFASFPLDCQLTKQNGLHSAREGNPVCVQAVRKFLGWNS
jgi:hypothetical protein